MSASESRDYGLINQLAEEFTQRIRKGERPSVREYCDKHPQIAEDLGEMLGALAALEGLKDADQAAPVPKTPNLRQIGEYQILREVGRGGMGVVYEAEQASLGRRVALKIMAGARTSYGLERFKREARAAARLHHTNIVPVFSVGDHDGMPYYVMQFIQGLGLNEVLHEVKRQQALGGSTAPSTADDGRLPSLSVSVAVVAKSLIAGEFEPPPESDLAAMRTEVIKLCATSNRSDLSGEAANRTLGLSGSTSSFSLPGQSTLAGRKLTYWQGVAQIGLQVADALDYAHKQGVLHRDIKPSNLLLDMHGVVWVTDFGLAKADDSDNLTQTGDVLGTLRYMPPEALEGKNDARSDVYALGLTLYELLALRPAFTERSREQLVKQLTTTDPPRLGSVSKAIPRDLQTVVHKAIEKDPAHRYSSAKELAADLRRFVDDRPIQARHINSIERAWRWCRRNPLVANLMVAVAVLLIAGTAVSTYFAIHAAFARDRADAKAQEAEDNAALARIEKVRADAKAQEAENNAAAANANLYVVRLNSAQMALETNNLPLARGFLEQLRGLGDKKKQALGWEWRYLWRQCNYELRTFRGHTEDIGGIVFSPDGAWLASSSDDDSVRIWESATGRQLSTIKVNSPWAPCLALSPDGKQLAVATDGNTATILDAATGLVLHKCQGHTNIVRGLAFSTDGARLFSVAEDSALKIWEVASGQELQSFPHPAGYLRCVTVSPDGKWLAVGGSDPQIIVRDAATGDVVHTWTGHPSGVYGIVFSPDGLRLATAGKDRLAKIWDVATGRELLSLAGHNDSIKCVCFHPDGTRIATVDHNRTVKIWDTNTGEELETLLGHARGVFTVAFSPDGRCLASAGEDELVHLWHAGQRPGPRILAGHDNQVRAVSFSTDGKQVISVGQDGKINIWDSITGRRQTLSAGTVLGYLGLTLSSDGRHLAAAGDLGIIEVWDLKTGQIVWRKKGHPSWLSAVAFSPDGKWLATGGDIDRVNKKEPLAIKLWEVATGDEVRSLLGHTEEVKGLVFTPDGSQLISGAQDETIRIWDMTTFTERQVLHLKTGSVNSVAIDHNGKLLAAACSNHTLKLFELPTGRELRTFMGHIDNAWSVAFNPDGTRLASSSFDKTVRIWDTATGLELANLKGHPDRVLDVAFSPNGNFLATAGGRDLTVRIWDARPSTPEVNVDIEAVGLLDYLFARPLPRTEIIAAILRDKTIGDATRKRALEISERYAEETDAKKYQAAAWQIVHHPFSNAILREFALAQAMAACRLAPENPINLATLAVAMYRLNRTDESRITFALLRDIGKTAKWADDKEVQAFLTETAAIIEEKSGRGPP
ncbi:MAG TPA: protein kinase [Gemmataceae bacterium]|jgi:WD40 repeat protein/serine/threonine protein kinase|nr:protein kinase [Gemmataceae bacterium]